ncbi:MAG: DNA repair protein RecN [Betaproteobacteria bacterium]|nr:MAG: DNA repair protein RecN [Betaproteobacteria bacterium]
MLRALDIRGFVLIEESSVDFADGFTVLTGETGAGKSMLVDAIELLVGGRGDAAAVRGGAERAELAAEFDVDPKGALAAWLAERDLSGDPGRVILRRTVDGSGRSRCFINGHAATLAQLKEAGEYLVDIHGQHVHQSLLRAAAQRDLLDAQAGAEPLASDTRDSYRDWKRLEAVAMEAQKNYAAREAERAEIQDRVTELKRISPVEGEWERVAAEHARLQHGSSLLAGAQSALEALTESEGAALAQLSAVASRLRALSAHDARLGPIVELVESAAAQAGEAVRELRHYASRVDLDPDALRAVEDRIEALHAAARRHRVRPEELPRRHAELEKRLAELELAVDPEALRREVAGERLRYEAAVKKLTAKRQRGAQAFSEAVTAGMQQLAIAGGRFEVLLNKLDEPGAAGAEEVEFQVASHPSLPLRPLARVASGGELSRISLAIQMVAAKASPVGTLVFDEVDAGIGGSVAETIGRALRSLGKERQVLCVTHLPQVAANGDQQWLVVKSASRGKVNVQASLLNRAARIEELARMLGGSESTARKHAAELLDAG